MKLPGRTVLRARTRVFGAGRWAAAAAAFVAASALAAPRPALQPSAETSAPLEGFTARSMMRLALMDLRAAPTAETSDYQIASLLLGFAQELAPGDEELIRRRSEAAWLAGDQDLLLELTRQLIRLDPRDTVAQLRLISARIAALQTAEERLRAYEDLLGPKGRSLDASVRSRLALDAALLLRERGDEAGFVERLKLATQLDSSNKDAATLAATFFASRVADPIGRLDLLANVLMADPIDPNVHLSIARDLAMRGAFKGARRFHGNARRIMTIAGEVPETVQFESLMLEWLTSGPAEVVSILDRDLMTARDEAARVIRSLERDHASTEGVRKPEDIKLPLTYNRLRTIAAFAAGDQLKAESVAAEIDAEASEALATLKDPSKWPEGAREEDMKLGVYSALADVLATRLWVKGGIQGLAPLLGQESQLRTDLLQIMPELEGWYLLRTGDPAGAIARLKPLAAESRFAALGIAIASEELGRSDDAERIYREMTTQGPLTLYGAWARDRLSAMFNETRPFGDPAPFENWTSTVPDWIDRLVLEPHRYVRLAVSLTDRSVEPVEASGVRLTLQNFSPIPLAVGADRPLNSRVLLAPKLDGHLNGRNAIVRPEVVDLERRLRLMPREELTITTWPDIGLTGWLIESAAAQSIRARWRAVHGFMFAPQGGYRPGVLCTESETASLTREPLLEARLTPDELAKKFAYDPERSLQRAAVGLRCNLLFGKPDQSPAQWSVAVNAIAQRYASLGPATRAMLLVTLPHATMAPEMTPFDAVAREETHPLPLAAFLVTRVTDPNDETLAKAAQSDDPRIRSLAGLVAGRLQRGGRLYARLTRDTLVPPPTAEQASAQDTP